MRNTRVTWYGAVLQSFNSHAVRVLSGLFCGVLGVAGLACGVLLLLIFVATFDRGFNGGAAVTSPLEQTIVALNDQISQHVVLLAKFMGGNSAIVGAVFLSLLFVSLAQSDGD